MSIIRRAAERAHRLQICALAAVLAMATLVGVSPGGAPRVLAVDWPSACISSVAYADRASELISNRYLFSPHPIVTLPSNPTWAENPLADTNWQYQFHSLRYVVDLLRTWVGTGETTYRDRALFLLRDWLADNPRSAPPSAFSWNDMATAWRTITFACAAELLPDQSRLRDALELHGSVLAEDSFYRHHGNHALYQDLGLLEAGRVLGRPGWTSLAAKRLDALALESVDSQGVTNEQALGYQIFNYNAYRFAAGRLSVAGITPGPGFARVALMPGILAAGSLPNGHLEMIGDTVDGLTPSYPGTATEFVATRGAVGTAPPVVSRYAAGYLFARSGWGTKRAFTNETFWSARWGPGMFAHGHADGLSITLAAWGSSLLMDAGKLSYNPGPWRRYFQGRSAHNVVTVDGLKWNNAARTALIGQKTTAALVDVRLRTSGYAGVTHTRRVTWSRSLDYLVVEDRLVSSRRHTYRQLWHLAPNARAVAGVSSVRTYRARSNVQILQLTGSPAWRIVRGATNPIQGWISLRYETKTAAQVAIASRTGSSVRFLTLIVPCATTRRVVASGLKLTPGGYELTVKVAGQSERIVANGAAVSITRVGG